MLRRHGKKDIPQYVMSRQETAIIALCDLINSNFGETE